MDDNRSEYNEAKALWLDTIQDILTRLSKHDEHYKSVKPKQTLSRINNNRMFHPNKPVYKDFFSCEPAGKSKGGSLFYMSIGLSRNFLGGGMWHPSKEDLDLVRDAIDYNGDVFKKIISGAEFKRVFGGLGHDPDKLKTSPKNYSKDHEHIDLLRHKSFIATKELTVKQVNSAQFLDLVEEAFAAIQPFSHYLKKAVSV